MSRVHGCLSIHVDGNVMRKSIYVESQGNKTSDAVRIGSELKREAIKIGKEGYWSLGNSYYPPTSIKKIDLIH